MNVPIIFGKDQIHQQILVCDIVSDGILGQDFLLSHATAINYKNSLINTKSFQIKCWIGGEANASCRVLTTERKHIPGSSKASVNVKIENPNSLSCLALVTKNTDLSEPNLLVIEGIITTTSDIFTIHVANTGEEPVSIFENVAVARCESYYETDAYDETEASISNTFSCNRIDEREFRGLPDHLQDLIEAVPI